MNLIEVECVDNMIYAVVVSAKNGRKKLMGNGIILFPSIHRSKSFVLGVDEFSI